MKNLKLAIIILLISIILILVFIFIVKNKKGENVVTEYETNNTEDFIKEMGLVDSYATAFSIEDMIKNYLLKISMRDSEAVYSILDSKYIEDNKINVQNVLDKIPDNLKNFNIVKVRKLYEQTDLKNCLYYMDGILQNDDSREEAYFIVYIDNVNDTFAIAHITKEDYEKGITKQQNAKRVITLNKYNKRRGHARDAEEIAERYFTDFVEYSLYETEYAYNLLDEEYKNKRFPTYEDFKKHILNKKDVYLSSILPMDSWDTFDMDKYLEYINKKSRFQLKGYQLRSLDEGDRYIIIDNYNNYYVFNTKTPLDYKIMLDTYTIDLPEFIETYEKATTQEKVGYNIEKIVNALNSEDYKYIYGKLADEFKANYFKTYEVFEKYAKQTFGVRIDVTYNKYTETADLSTYEIVLKGNTKTVTKTIVMQLREGTDFVMSFNIQ